MQKNVYFRCLTSLVDSNILRKLLESGDFENAQLLISQSLIGCKVDRFLKHGLVAKLFLVCLFMTVNSQDKTFVEKARSLCLATLPLMFKSDEKFKDQVEVMVKQGPTS